MKGPGAKECREGAVQAGKGKQRDSPWSLWVACGFGLGKSFCTSDLRPVKGINVCLFNSPSLRQFVTAAIGN